MLFLNKKNTKKIRPTQWGERGKIKKHGKKKNSFHSWL